MKTIMRHFFTASDNKSWDIGRFLWALGCLFFILFEMYQVYKTGIFDMSTFGMGYGGLLMTGGGTLLLKKSTEPPSDNTNV